MTDKYTKNSNKDTNKGIEDKALWDHVTKDIAPLHYNETKETIPLKSPQKTKKLSRPDIKDHRPATTTQTKSQEYKENPQTDRRTSQRLKQGKTTIDMRLDLHGLSQNQAYDALLRVVPDAFKNGKRCILIITGKGGNRLNHSMLNQTIGILKQKTPEWLSQPPLSQYILKIEPAKPKDGGAGAFYVLLKRQR